MGSTCAYDVARLELKARPAADSKGKFDAARTDVCVCACTCMDVHVCHV